MAWFSDKIGRKLNYMIETKVTYTLERDGHFYLVENVPARISPETGEQFFSPETVQRLQSFIFQKQEPKKVVQTPVFEFATWFGTLSIIAVVHGEFIPPAADKPDKMWNRP